MGDSVASEIETQHVQREGEKLADRLILWITYHVWGWIYLFPFGHLENSECYRQPDEPLLVGHFLCLLHQKALLHACIISIHFILALLLIQ